MFNKIALSGVPNGFNNFSFGMLFSVIFHGSIFVATIFALPFVAKKPIELLPSISVELIQISEQMNIPYAPKAAKIIEKAKTENKQLLSEQAPPKEIKKEINKQVKFDNQKDEIDLSKSKKIPVPEKKQEKIKLEKSEAVPLPDKKLEKIETKEETAQQPSKENKKTLVEKEKRKKIEKQVEKDLVIKEFVKKTKPIKDDKAIQASEYEKKELDVDLIKGLIAKQYENVGEVKKKSDGTTQSEDKSMRLTKLSVTTEYSIQMQYKDCWSPPIGGEYKKNDYLVTVKLDLEKNGRVKSREILERNRMGIDSKYRIFAESVDRAVLKCNPLRNLPIKNYEDWVRYIFGDGIADSFMLPYSKKFWGVDPKDLTTDWVNVRHPRPSTEEVITGAISDQKKGFGINASFRYPKKGGFGYIGERLAESCKGRVNIGMRATEVDVENKVKERLLMVATDMAENKGGSINITRDSKKDLKYEVKPIIERIKVKMEESKKFIKNEE